MDDFTDTAASAAGAAGAVGGDSGGAPSADSSPAAASNGHAESFAPTQPTYLDAPNSWKREVADRHWGTLPHDLRAYVHQRETEAQRAITQYGHRAKQYEPFEQLLSTYGTMLPQGMAPHDAIGRLFQAQAMLDADPRAALTHLMTHYSVDPMALLPQEIREYFGGLAQQLEHSQRLAMAREESMRMAEERRAAEVKRADEVKQAQRLADAQRAARLNVRSSSAAQPNPQSPDDTMRETARRLYGSRR